MHIEFFSVMPGVKDAYPILPASKFEANWINNLKQDYIQNKSNEEKRSHLYKCPGIFDLFNHGFIIPAYTDLLIDSNSIRDMMVKPASDNVEKQFKEYAKGEMIQFHSYETVAKYFPYKSGTVRALLKINTPWYVVAPKNTKFIVLPIAYPDEMLFEQTIGILDPANNAELNCQMYWHKPGERHVIKAGTPLFHIIPMTSENVTFECRDATEYDLKWRDKSIYLAMNTFNKKRNMIRRLYNEHFAKKESKCPFSSFFKR